MSNKKEKGILRLSFNRRAIQFSLLLLMVCFVSSMLMHSSIAQDGVKIRRLSFTVKTGDDDLRGGNDNLHVAINFRDGNVQFKRNVNHGQRWADNSIETFDISLDRPVPLSEIASITFQKPTGGVSGADEWHMSSVSIRATGDGIDKVIVTHGFQIFNGDELTMLVTAPEPGKATKLELTIKTGGDDLRGNVNNLYVTTHFRDGTSQRVTNVNGGEAWGNGSTHVKVITLDHAVLPSDIVRIDLWKNPQFAGEFSTSDNWDMDSISIKAIGAGVDKVIGHYGAFRFTDSHATLLIPITLTVAGKANKLELTIITGDDDLRGDHDNLNIIVHFRGGRIQPVPNINGGKAWHNGSVHVQTFTLAQAVYPSDIVEVDLQTTFTGGMGGDNWNLDSVTVKAIGEDVNEVIFKDSYKRFTGEDKILRLKKP